MLNHVVLTGNLGADPEISYSKDGVPIASYNIAFESSKEKTSWIGVTCFNKLAEVSEGYLHKGARIAVAGKLSQDTWKNDAGEKRSTHRIIAHSIEFIKVRETTEPSTPLSR